MAKAPAFANTSPRCKSGRRQDGFTLMELIIVSSLALLFLSLSVPALRNAIFVDELDATARKIIGTVHQLRNLAVRQHKPYLLHFEVEENRIWFEEEGAVNPFDDEPRTAIQLPQSVRMAEISTHSQGRIDLGTITLWISRQGYMDRTVLRLDNDNGRSRHLLFSPFSALAKVVDENEATIE